MVGLNFVNQLRWHSASNKFMIVAPPKVGYEDIRLAGGSNMIIYSGGINPIKQWEFDTLELPKLVSQFGADVVFAMGNVGLVSPCCPQAVLFHKSQLVYPRKHFAKERWKPRARNWLLKNRLRKCLKRTQLVLCQTPVSAQRFHQEFNYPRKQIKIMPNSVSEFVKTSRDEALLPEVFKKQGFFNLFFLTKFYAHKNLEMLIDVFRRGNNVLRDVRCIVTVAADQHPNAPVFLDSIRRYGLQQYIVNVGPLKPEELPGYFYNSDALLFPTLLESFSGTYLEAMHFGLPILTSDLDFSRYVCGDAALYFDPWDPDDIIKNIELIRSEPARKEDLILKGRERVARFVKSWNEITEDTLRELEAIAN